MDEPKAEPGRSINSPADVDSESPSSISQTNPRGAGTKRKRAPTSGSSGGGVAAAAAGVSSRSVASLTPEQLEKKRKNDREAQRAIRERTKSHIDTLNDKIRAYQESQPQIELAAAQRQKEQIQEENDDLRRTMGQVIDLLQPHASRLSSSLKITRESANYAKDRQQPSVTYTSAGRFPPMQVQNGDLIEPASVPAIKSPIGYTPSQSSQDSYSQVRGPAAPQPLSRSWPSPTTPAADSAAKPEIDERETPFIPGDEVLERGYILNNTNNNFVQLPYAVTPEQKTPAPFTPPIYQLLPRAVHDCALDGVLLRFLGDTQLYHETGISLHELEGPPQPSFNGLLNPSTSHVPHELSKMLLGILYTLPDLSRLAEQVATMHMMYLLMRWQIRPTKQNYDAMPTWLQPRLAQIFVTHPHWLDYIPWPRLRDACVQTVPYVSFEDFFVPYTRTFSINWPHSPELCLMPAPPGYPHHHHPRQNNGNTARQARQTPSSQHSTPAAGSPFAPPLPLSSASQAQYSQQQQQQQQQQQRQAAHSHSPHSTHNSPAPNTGLGTPTLARATSVASDRSASLPARHHQSQHHHHYNSPLSKQTHPADTASSHGTVVAGAAGAAPSGAVGAAVRAETEPQMILSPAFEAHIMNLDNWSLGPAFREQYPQWTGLWRLRE